MGELGADWLESVWPNQRDDWKLVGGEQLQLVSVIDFNVRPDDKFSKAWEAAQLGKGLVRDVFLPGPFASSFLHIRDGRFFDVYSNTGQHLFMMGSSPPGMVNAFWCENGYLGILGSDGAVAIATAARERRQSFAMPADVREFYIDASYSFIGGIAVAVNQCEVWIFKYPSGWYREMEYRQEKDSTTAVAYDEAGEDKVALAFASRDGASGAVWWPKGSCEIGFTPRRLKFKNGQVIVIGDDDIFVCGGGGKAWERKTDNPPTSAAVVGERTAVFVEGSNVHLVGRAVDSVAHQVLPMVGFAVMADRTAVRVLTKDYAFQLAPVHPSVLALRAAPLTTRVGLLVKAYDLFSDRNVESYKIREGLKDLAGSTVTAIMEACRHIPDINVVARLLKVCGFAKLTVANFDHDSFKNLLVDLRVTRTLIGEGFCIDASVLSEETRPRIVECLVQLQKFAIAGQLCTVFGLNHSVICENWACHMFQRHKARFLDMVLARVREYPAIDFLRLSEAAQQMGVESQEVARIVAFVREPKLRFFFLRDVLRLEEESKTCVLESLDGDAVVSYLGLARLASKRRVAASRSTSGEERFASLLQSSPVFVQHYLAYRKYLDVGVFGRLSELPPIRRMALELVHLDQPKHGEWGAFLERSKGGEGQGFVGGLKAAAVYGKYEHDWQQSGAEPARSARHRMVLLLAAGDAAAAEKVSKVFETDKADRRFLCWTRLRTFLKYGMVEELGVMAGQNQPVPAELLAEECFERGQQPIGVEFARRIKDAGEKHRILARYECWEEAALVAQKELRDGKLAEEDRAHLTS